MSIFLVANNLEVNIQMQAKIHCTSLLSKYSKIRNASHFDQQVKTWIATFADLGHKCIGYARERVTGYLQSAAYHVPNMVKRYENLKQFSGQGILSRSLANIGYGCWTEHLQILHIVLILIHT